MANYMGIIYKDPEDTNRYGYDLFKTGERPAYYLKNDSHNPDLNIQDFDTEDVRNGLDESRSGVPEPEGECTVTAHTRSIPTALYGALGQYLYTPSIGTATDGSEKQLNCHEFWIGETLERPEFCAEFTYGDFMLKRIFGGIIDGLTWNATLEKTTLDLKFIYQDEAVKKISLEGYKDNFAVLNALPLVGYDYTVQIGKASDDPENVDANVSKCFKDLTLTIENNHTTGEDNRCLGSYFYGFKPTMESCNIDIEANTKFDRRNYEFIVGAMHNQYSPNDEGWNRLAVCKTFNKQVYIKAQSCIDPDEYVEIIFPKCRVTLDPIDGDSNVIEVKLNLKPFTTSSVILNDGTTSKTTPMYVKVVSKTGRVGKDVIY